MRSCVARCGGRRKILGAWEAYQRRLWHAGKANAADNEVELGFFRRAIELDPTFAAPHSMLAQNYGWGFASGGVKPVSEITALAESEAGNRARC